MDAGKSVRCLTVDVLRTLEPVQMSVIGRGQLWKGESSPILRPLLTGDPAGVADSCDNRTGPAECLP